MSTGRDDLLAHLATGATTVCQCWAVTRKDGEVLGFTDHDRDLSFGGITFKAATGMTARALQQSTGLSVDNSEAIGALSDASVSETDLLAGRFDGAEVQNWMVNWQDTSQRILQFRGTFGEVTRSAGSFKAELRGLSEALNQVQGLVYQKTCSAVLGDARCGFDLNRSGFAIEVPIEAIEAPGVYLLPAQTALADGWFRRGRVRVMTGASAGLVGLVKFDREDGTSRRIDLWVDLPLAPVVGDVIRLEAGCDKLAGTCQAKFNNFNSFRGFPHIPGEDWMTSYPVSGKVNDGESLFK
ncbi:DUF2163 domain-containing protein [bacterium]|nr:DUF2163 domain-containing protein [bacterium]